jgi:hypothetical protein
MTNLCPKVGDLCELQKVSVESDHCHSPRLYCCLTTFETRVEPLLR